VSFLFALAIAMLLFSAADGSRAQKSVGSFGFDRQTDNRSTNRKREEEIAASTLRRLCSDATPIRQTKLPSRALQTAASTDAAASR